MEQIFFEITIIIALAAGLTILFRFLKQPPILAYIVTGILLGPLGLFHIESHEALKTLGQLGITLLLFMLGLELKLRELRSIGKTAVSIGALQMISTFAAGFGISLLLGFPQTTAFYIGIAVSFSSTIIIVKLLSDKKDLTSLHGKLAIGVLLMQDFFAVMTIMFLTNGAGGEATALLPEIGIMVLKVIVLFGWIIFLSRYVFPFILRKIARSHEALFLFSLAWVFLLTAFVSSPFIGFSIEIGGFLAGLALANANENFQIVAKMKALRDFFVTIFFVLLGLEMSFANLSTVIFPAGILILFVILIKPFLIMIITGLQGFRKRTSFLVGTCLGQVSEFSFIILFLGREQGVIPPEVVTMILLVGIVSFGVSTYYMQQGQWLYISIGKHITFLERKKGKEPGFGDSDLPAFDKHIVLIGGHDMGRSILQALNNTKEQVLVVDFDPDVVQRLKDQGAAAFFGDIADSDIQERVGIDKAKMIISTVPDLEDNLLLIQAMNHVNRRAKILVMAYEGEDAKELYRAGADYVILPHIAGGNHIAKILVDKNHLELIEDYKARDKSLLK